MTHMTYSQKRQGKTLWKPGNIFQFILQTSCCGWIYVIMVRSELLWIGVVFARFRKTLKNGEELDEN